MLAHLFNLLISWGTQMKIRLSKTLDGCNRLKASFGLGFQFSPRKHTWQKKVSRRQLRLYIKQKWANHPMFD